METSTNKHLKAISIAAISSVPVLGGPLSVILDTYIPDHIQKRREEFLDQLSKSLDIIAGNRPLTEIHTDRFASIFIKCAKMALEESSHIKREALRNIILNAAISPESEFDETTMFIRLITDLTEDQLRFIHLIQKRHSPAAAKSKDFYDVFREQWPDINEDYVMACVSDMMTFNILTSHWSSVTPENNGHSLSTFGKRLLDYITDPLEKDDDPEIPVEAPVERSP